MEYITIIKISSKNFDELDINGKFNIIDKKIYFSLTGLDYKKIFGDREWDDYEKINFILVDENGKNYSCFGCIINLHLGDLINVEITSIDLIIEGISSFNSNIPITSISLDMYYPSKCTRWLNIEEFKIRYSKNIIISISKNFVDGGTLINLNIESKKVVKKKKLNELLNGVVELIYLMLGYMPVLKNTYAMLNDKRYLLYFDFAEKYISRKNQENIDNALCKINKETMTKELINNYLNFRKNSGIIFDYYLILTNTNGYVEMTNSSLIQLIEGTYKTLTNTSKDLREILNYYFIDNKTIKKILNKNDLRKANDIHKTAIFLLKAKEHRHYLSHLNMNQTKNNFKDIENIYARYKLILALRIIYMQQLNIPIDQIKYKKIIDSINTWAKKHKFRYKNIK